jgi:hypothetical protein
MKTHILVFLALAGFTAFAGIQVRADTFVTITQTGASAATVTPRWAIGNGQSGLAYDDSSSGFPGSTATNFFTITGTAITTAVAPTVGASPNGFTSYVPTGAATDQASVNEYLTANSYSGLTYVAANLSLIGPLSFYAIHHGNTGDYLALIQPSVPTVSDQKPMSVAGGPATVGGTGYFALSYAADNPGLWGANLFYYLRTDVSGHTQFGSLIPALLSGPTDRWDLGAGHGYTDLAYTSTDLGFGFGPSQFYYLRLDPTTQTTFFGTINPLTGVATDIQNLGGIYRTLTFTTTNVGYGANNFYSIGQTAALTAQTITFASFLGHTACDAPFTFVLPVATSSLPVTLTVSGPATLSGNTVTLTGAVGTVVLTASQAGNATFAAATNVVQSFAVVACAVAPTPQTITFASFLGHTACDAPFTFVLPMATSGLPVTLTVSGPATLSGNTVTLTGAVGTVVLTASQAGNATFASAPPVTQTFAVVGCAVAPTPQTITFASFPGHTACDAPFTFVLPVATSGLPVTLTVSGPATLSGNTVTLTGAVGTVVLTASQAGNATFASAPPVTQTFAVVACAVAAPSPTAQAINFAPLPGHTACDAPFTFVLPVATSGLPVTLTVSGPATLSGNTVTLTGAVGTVVLTASQVGNATFALAPSVVQSFAVAECGTIPIITSPVDVQNYGVPVSPNIVAGTVGTPIATYLITASGSPTSYAATLLPPGLSVNELTGAITGTPTTANTWFTTIQATNATGTGSATLIIVIAPAGVAPLIAGATSATGTIATPFGIYQIIATGMPTSYAATGLPAGLTLNPLTGAISGTPTVLGTFVVTIAATNSTGTSTAFLTITIAPQPSSRIVNFSARAMVGPGSQAQITGFVVSGNNIDLLLRGVGPTLTSFGISNALANPVLTLAGPNGVIATNSEWQTPIGGQAAGTLIAAAAAQAGAFALPNGSNDSALLVTLNNGAYTTSLVGLNGTSGIGFTEIYDTDTVPGARLINVSARVNVAAGASVPIAGLVIAGNAPETVLIRGVGPTLASFGVTGALPNPMITVFSGTTQIAADANWATDPSTAAQISTAAAQAGAFPLPAGSNDAALLLTLQPGAYTMQVTSVSNGTGVVLLEVYEVP